MAPGATTDKNSRKPARKKGQGREYCRLLLLRALRGLWQLAQIAGMVALIPAAWKLVNILEKSPLFAIDQIQVEGCRLVDEEVVRTLSNVRKGTSLLKLNIGNVSRRLEAHPTIQNATVVKRFPRCLALAIRERQALALVPIQGSLYYLDRQGVVFHRTRPGDQLDLPIITGLEGYPWTPGRQERGRLVQEALALIGDLEAGNLLRDLSEVRVDPSQGLSFYLESLPVPVRTGWERFQQRRLLFERAIPLLMAQREEILAIDLSFAGQIVLQRVGGKRLKEVRISKQDRGQHSCGEGLPPNT